MSTGAKDNENGVASWIAHRRAVYRRAAIEKLSVEYELILDAPFQSEGTTATIDAIPSVRTDRKERAELVPLRIVPSNKINRIDRVMAAYEALVISKSCQTRLDHALIIYGDKHSRLSFKVSHLFRDVKNAIEKTEELISNPSPPQLSLNDHCPKCEYRYRCLRAAHEKNDLSLLSNLGKEERSRLNRKGIFTVYQLSYTFRPRRRIKRLASKPEKYHHSLKALAIRERKTHVVGQVQLQIDGTSVVLDVEGIPDRDFFYLMGIQFDGPQGLVHQHFWADSAADEPEMWHGFLDLLSRISKPVLLHYGSYEKVFLDKMLRRYGGPNDDSPADQAIRNPINILSLIYARVYFPTYSNGLKDIAGFLGFQWSDPLASGLQSLIWRHEWEDSRDPALQQKLIAYNTDDCLALHVVIGFLNRLTPPPDAASGGEHESVRRVETLAKNSGSKWREFQSPLQELVQVNAAAHWDYQRDRVFVRSGILEKRFKIKRRSSQRPERPTMTLPLDPPVACPECGGRWRRTRAVSSRTVQDLIFGRSSVKRRVVDYQFRVHRCRDCGNPYKLHEWYERGRMRKWGWNLRAYFVYHAVGLRIPQLTLEHSLNRLFDLQMRRSTLNNLKIAAADFYSTTAKKILERLTKGSLVHIDETAANIKGHLAYVWVMTNLNEVVYILAESREGEFAKELLKNFKGVLVSDFYAAYDGIDCKQQKCLIHLMRDLNEEILNNPFDQEIKSIVVAFAALLKSIVETIDRRGLKKHFLRKHRRQVDNFYRFLDGSVFRSDAATKCQQRFQKNRNRLFTFLDFNAVPWNNNNAEHAIKAFARLRKVISGTSTRKGIEEYLTLLTVAQTCEYRRIDFLDFLRSGERDIERFAIGRKGAGLVRPAVTG